MPPDHREIPTLPVRPRDHPIAESISRSYPVGRQNFSRAFQGQHVLLQISAGAPLAPNVRANLIRARSPNDGLSWTTASFERQGDRTFICRLSAEEVGLHSFRAEFSLDDGETWLRDTVPDSWIWIDPPQVDAVRIYTFIPDVSGTINDWKSELKRIASMGFNAIHLLPVTTMDKSQSPYSAKDLFSVDPSYLISGSREDGLAQLEDFISEAKKEKIRLIFDLVLNHVGVQSAMATRAPDWISPDQKEPDGLRRARYWSDQGWRTWSDLVLINYEHPSDGIRAEIYAYMTDYALFWAKYANDTGGFVRFDNLHSSNVDFVSSLTASLRREYPMVGIIAEYFTDESTTLRNGSAWGLSLSLATPWNYKFVPELRDYLRYIQGISGRIRYYMPLTSHDSGSPAQEFGSVESTVPRYVAAALLGTGATGMPQGVEFGEKERINFIGRPPKMPEPPEPKFARFITRVNQIQADHPAFRCGDNCMFVDNNHAAIIAAFRKSSAPDSAGFLVLCNFDIRDPQRIVIDLAAQLGQIGPFTAQDLLTGEPQTFETPKLDLLLPPCAAQVLSFQKKNGPSNS
jgi:hypothetical protein